MKEITIRNLDNYELSNRNGMYGGNAGSKDGILINGEYWIVKYPKSTKFLSGDKSELGSYSTAPLSEFIGSHIYDILGYDVHETILGYRNNKIVVACKDFCESENIFLREFRTIKNIYNKDVESMIEEHLSSTSSSNSLEIEELLIHLKYNPILSKIEGITERFWDCAVVDAFIANNDRNNGNWGLLVENNEYKLAPIFDNGASFANKASEEKIKRMLANPHAMESSALNAATMYSDDGKILTFKKLAEKFIDNIEFCRALKKNVELIRSKFDEISEFISEIPETYEGELVCSPARKEFYTLGLEIRLEKMFEPLYEKIEEYYPELKKKRNMEIKF